MSCFTLQKNYTLQAKTYKYQAAPPRSFQLGLQGVVFDVKQDDDYVVSKSFKN